MNGRPFSPQRQTHRSSCRVALWTGIGLASLGCLRGIQAASPSGCVAPPEGLVAWWPGESNTWDVVGGFDGGFLPIPPTGSQAYYTNGVVGMAFQFTLRNFITVPANAALDVGRGDGFTFEAWMHPNRSDTGGVFGWGLPQVRLEIGKSGELIAYLVKTNGQSNVLRTSPATVQAGAWQHIALSCNTASGDMALYINGTPAAQTNLGPVALRTSGTFNIGSADGRGYLQGSLDEPALYARALSQAEIQSIYLAGQAGKCAPPPQNCIPLAADIAGWWRGESNALDSITINHGLMQPPGFPTALGYSPGRYGTAFSLRQGNYVTVPASSSLNLGTGPGLTVEAWANPVTTSFPIVEWNSGTGTQGVYLAYSATRGPAFLEANLVDDQGQSHLVLSPFLAPVFNQWRHVAVTYDKASGSAVLFVDGTAVTQTNVGSFTPRTTGDLYLGYRPPGAYPGSGSRFNGSLDEVTVYRRALSATEMRCLMAQGDAGKYPPLTECLAPAPGIFAWWRGESNLVDSVGDNNGSAMYPGPAPVLYTDRGRMGKSHPHKGRFDTELGLAIGGISGLRLRRGGRAALQPEGQCWRLALHNLAYRDCEDESVAARRLHL